MRTMIVAGGRLTPAFLNKMAAACPPEYVIAADRGIDVLLAAGRRPDLILGDFDSTKLTAGEIDDVGAALETFPAEKDYSDLELALNEAVRRGSSDITVLGATGGRLDHFLANVMDLRIPLAAGIPARIVDEQNILSLHEESFAIRRDGDTLSRAVFGERTPERYVSLLPMSGKSRVSLSGLYYGGEGLELKQSGASFGVSNRFAAEAAEIRVEDGTVLLVESVDALT